MDTLDTKKYKNYKEFVAGIDKFLKKILRDDYQEEDLVIVAKYDEIQSILRNILIAYPTLGIAYCELEDNNITFGYCDEYYLAINSDGVWCEKAKHNNKYRIDESTFAFVSNDCNSTILKHMSNNYICAFEVCNDDEEKEVSRAYSESHDSSDKTEKHNAKTVHKSITTTYLINGQEVTKEKYDRFFEDLMYY